MKTGKTLIELAEELMRQKEQKKDFLVNTQVMEYKPEGTLNFVTENENSFELTELAHEQVATRLEIPIKYYKRMREDSRDLLANNINHWFQKEPKKQLVRTLDGRARAYLSDRYRRIDNFDLAEAILPVANEIPGARLESCEITERRMYLKFVNESLELEVNKGDVVKAGFVITNSEVGLSSVKIEPLIYRLVCKNGLIAPDYAMRKSHLGRIDGTEEAQELFSNETLQADDKAFFMKVQDTVRGAVDLVKFELIVNKMREAQGQLITGDSVKAVEVFSNKYSLNKDENNSVLAHLLKGDDLSKYGMLNAVTRTAQDVPSYDRATELEALGGRFLEMSAVEWKSYAEAV